jgi:hypothetical protein
VDELKKLVRRTVGPVITVVLRCTMTSSIAAGEAIDKSIRRYNAHSSEA